MDNHVRLEPFGLVRLNQGLPANYTEYHIPSAKVCSIQGEWGTICFQEVVTRNGLLRHLLFDLTQTVSLYLRNKTQALQSFVSLSGHFAHRIKNEDIVVIGEKDYVLFHAGEDEAVLTVHSIKRSSLINTVYATEVCEQFFTLFPPFKKDLLRAAKNNRYFSFPKVARYTIHDSVRGLWVEKYLPQLMRKYVEIKIQSTLLSLLIQTYTGESKKEYSLVEREHAAAARDLILRDIKAHYTPKQIAAQLYVTAPWLQKAFSKVYGMGMFQFLRKTRMMIARERLLRGESLKVVAIDIGMKPRNFPKEFKAFFGYTVSDLKKGNA